MSQDICKPFTQHGRFNFVFVWFFLSVRKIFHISIVILLDNLTRKGKQNNLIKRLEDVTSCSAINRKRMVKIRKL